MFFSNNMSNAFYACSHYGRNRHLKYPDYFFCHLCDKWDNRDPLNKRVKRTMAAYKCIAKHTCSDILTQLNTKKIFSLLLCFL